MDQVLWPATATSPARLARCARHSHNPGPARLPPVSAGKVRPNYTKRNLFLKKETTRVTMVKAVVAEEAQMKLAEDRISQSAVPSEVGLVIGRLSFALDRGFVFDLVATPANDAGDPASSLVDAAANEQKKGPKGKSRPDSSSLVIDQDWVAEHARQVSRMLVGGMKVVGVYVWVSDSAYRKSTIPLFETVKGVAEAARILGTNLDEQLLIHISYSPRRWTCRNCLLTSSFTSSNLRPCDFKMGRVLTSFQTFRCKYNFDLRLPILCDATSDCKTLTDFLRYGISIHVKDLAGANAIIDGNLVEDDACASDGFHEVELLLPFSGNVVHAYSQKEVGGVLAFSGSVCSFAFVNSKELISQALLEIKEDIIKSLQTRIDILCDEAGDMSAPSNDISTEKHSTQLVLNSLRKHCRLSFPRRVFVPWLAGTYICDYLQSFETHEVLKEHCVELMSMEAPANFAKILQPENEAPYVDVKSFCEAALPFCKPRSCGCGSRGQNRNRLVKEHTSAFAKLTGINIVAAVLIVLLSMLAALLLFSVKGS